MYQIISISAFLILLIVMGINCLIRPCKNCWAHPLKTLVHIFTLLFIEQKLALAGVVRKLFYLLGLLCFIVLGITGFYPTLCLGEHISGWLLMIHATFAPIFAICLAVLAVLWAGSCKFAQNDWPWLEGIIQRITLLKYSNPSNQKGQCIGQKICFWLIVFLTLPLILSVIMSMFPYFGTYWQDLLLGIHRYTALIFALAVITHLYLYVRAQIKQ